MNIAIRGGVMAQESVNAARVSEEEKSLLSNLFWLAANRESAKYCEKPVEAIGIKTNI